MNNLSIPSIELFVAKYLVPCNFMVKTYFVLNICCSYVIGVKAVLVNLISQKGEVKFDPAYIMASQIGNKITELGYPAVQLESETAGQSSVELTVSLLFYVYYTGVSASE